MTTSSTSSVSTTSSGLMQISGLASGMDTSSMISELMAIAAEPQQQEEQRLTLQQSTLSATQGLNTAIAGLAASAQTFESGSTWTQLAATSSNSAVTVTASSSAVQGNLNVKVNNLASAATYQLADANSASDSGDSTFTSTWQAGHTYTVADGANPPNAVTFTLPAAGQGTGAGGDISPEDVASAMQSAIKQQTSANSTPPKFSATVAHTAFDRTTGDPTASGDYLEIAAVDTGTQSNFTITDNGTDTTGATGTVIASTDGSVPSPNATVSAGLDASLTINGNLQVASASNSGIQVEDGVTLSLGSGAAGTVGADGTVTGNTATINLNDNGGSRASAVQSFVSQINSVLSSIYSSTSYGTIPTTSNTSTYTQGQTSSATSNAATGAGALAGDQTVRSIADNLINAIFPADGSTLENYGISVAVNSDGTSSLSFDSSMFTTAYQANPTAVTKAFSGSGTTTGTNIVNGASVTIGSFASRIQDAATAASADGMTATFSDGTVAPTGSLTSDISSQKSQITSTQTDITNWTDILQQKQQTLETTYANLETSLSKVQSQSSWLTSELASLNS